MSGLTTEAPPERAHNILENGMHLTGPEFLRRYEASPEIKKAELVQGIVYMASPLRMDGHADPDSLITTWLRIYKIATPGTKSGANPTVRLGRDDIPQPDSILMILPEFGGQSHVDSSGYLTGAPEFVAEIAASSASMDAREKFESYRRAGVLEYLLWRTEDEKLNWWFLDKEEYQPLPVGEDGIIRSKIFPGLWLDTQALLVGNDMQVIETLRRGLTTSEHRAFCQQLERARSAAS
jgi:Uma2 family endonuclease